MTLETSTFKQAVAALRQGEPVVVPTDTVYGIAVAPGLAHSPQVLYDLKERDRGKPVAWLVGGAEDLDRYGADVPAGARALARQFWPGPLTLVVKASEAVAAPFRSAEGTIGLRMPDSAVTLALIKAVGRPLATTSANRSGQAPTRLFAALDPALVRRVAVLLADEDDSGKSGVASSVVDCTQSPPRIIRTGALSSDAVLAVLEHCADERFSHAVPRRPLALSPPPSPEY